jgi:hypothetical protein
MTRSILMQVIQKRIFLAIFFKEKQTKKNRRNFFYLSQQFQEIGLARLGITGNGCKKKSKGLLPDLSLLNAVSIL